MYKWFTLNFLEVMLMDLLLDVPYSEKDEAKKNGALWNPNIKKWYVKEDPKQDYYENWNYYFEKWLPKHNLLCRNLFVFQMNRKCWKCGKNTKVICLATNDAYTLFMGEIFDDRYQNLQLLSYVSKIPEELATFLKEKYNYYPSYSNFVKKTYYINHCEFCKSVQGDNFLHEVPEEAFYKHLCYNNSEKSDYYRVKNNYLVPILAELPYYDLVSHSSELIEVHMQTEKENRASLHITQKVMDGLLDDSNYIGNIIIDNI